MCALPSAAPATIGPSQMREVLSHFPTGVVAVTALDEGHRVGMAVGSFMSVSLEPPLVAFCAAHTSSTWPRVQKIGRFCVNVLAREQADLCRRLAASGGDKFDGLHCSSAPSGAPILSGALGWIDCELDLVRPLGDHDLVVGRVVDLATGSPGDPLLFFRRDFGGFAADND